MISAFVVIVGLLVAFVLAGHALRHRYPTNDAPLIDVVDELLPQTQCAQCGYPGCRPYAEALVEAEAATDLCPPGGEVLFQTLNELLDRSATVAPLQPAPTVALIDEAACIGCTLCLPPCPVDAIVGAQNLMHTVIEAQCTGCELCVPACPVDCISMIETTATEPTNPRIQATHCISCGACDPVCPKHLPVQALTKLTATQQPNLAAKLNINACIECELCDDVCPSQIPLASIFGSTKRALQIEEENEARKTQLKARYAAHQSRLETRAQAQQTRREKRLRTKRSQTWS